MKFIKFIVIFILAFLSVNCQENRRVKINYPDGDKILYSEFTGLETQRLVLFSLEEQKEYEIPISSVMKGFPDGAIFSPDGKKILIKGPDYIDDIYIFDLTTSEWQEKILPALNHPGERDYFFYDYIDDSTVVFKGLYNLFIFSLNTKQLLDKIAVNDTFFIYGYDVNSSQNLLYLNYGKPRVTYNNESAKVVFNNEPINILLYDYKNKKYDKYYSDTGKLFQWIKGTNNLFMMDSIAIKFNMENGEKIRIKVEQIDENKILFPYSRFIDDNRFLMLVYGTDVYKNDFYIYDFRDKSLKQITNTKTFKTLMDVYIK